jgi:hypothetical protein
LSDRSRADRPRRGIAVGDVLMSFDGEPLRRKDEDLGQFSAWSR